MMEVTFNADHTETTKVHTWQKGDKCQLKGKRGIFEVYLLQEGLFPTANIVKLDSNGNQMKKHYTGISLNDLLRTDEDQPSLDMEGRTAYEAALELTKSGFVMTDFVRP
ncbi:hypothetical protein [Brevibacillus reuszeri]|uniref:hypothetical protein n=1 Tax=Brevibacillus reuszeri TaxID=54915 RepID=UPI003D1FF7B1